MDDELPTRRTRTAEVLDAGGGFLTRVGKMTPAQAQTAILVVLTLAMCFFIWNGDRNRNVLESDRVALLLRTQESEAEKNRTMMAAEFAANRAAFAGEGKVNREAVMEVSRMMMESQRKLAVEITRLEEAVSGLRRKLPQNEDAPELSIPSPRIKISEN